jgi:hypothetical protein
MARWTPKEQLIRHRLWTKESDHPRRKALKDRFAIARAIAEHLKLCRWEFSKPSEQMQ